MKSKYKVIITAIIALFLLIGIPFISYAVMTGPVSNNDELVLFEVKEGTTANQVVTNLENAKLIKSGFFTKISMKINNLSDFKTGVFSLSRNLDTKEILHVLNTAPVTDTVNVTIPEGYWAEQIAETFAASTNVSVDDFLKLWKDETFLKELIEKYDFLDDRILNPEIRYGVEGFLFPDTYNVFANGSSAREITLMMLDEMDAQLTTLQDTIKNTGWDVYDLVILSSIVEYEARTHEDRILVAGVFLNRIDAGMKFESCATVSYALNEHLFRVSAQQASTDSPYNTYVVSGLPVGPVMNPSMSSIKATITAIENQKSGNGHDYLYFMSDINNSQQMFFAKTLAEHEKNVEKYLD